MSLISNKSLDSITESDLQDLINAKESESKVIEYKKELPKFDNIDDKKEFLADVSSFANASGGDLIYGIIAKNGVPEYLCGLEITVPIEQITMRLENIIRSNIDPKIPGISIIEITVLENKYVIIIRIPRSWASPHMITIERKGDARFFSRFSKGKFDLDVSEIRAAFVLSEAREERIRNFRIDRISKLIAGETPVRLDRSPKMVLHIIPLAAFDFSLILDNSSFRKNLDSLPSINGGIDHTRYNLDGFLVYNDSIEPEVYRSYVQVFRNGIIESVDRCTHEGGIPGVYIDSKLHEILPKYISAQKQFGTEPPFLVMFSLVGVLGYPMDVKGIGVLGNPRAGPKMDRDVVQIPEVLIEDFDYDLYKVLKPILDAFWNSAGYEKSPHFDSNGVPNFGPTY
jgi:hypothetical protein